MVEQLSDCVASWPELGQKAIGCFLARICEFPEIRRVFALNREKSLIITSVLAQTENDKFWDDLYFLEDEIVGSLKDVSLVFREVTGPVSGAIKLEYEEGDILPGSVEIYRRQEISS